MSCYLNCLESFKLYIQVKNKYNTKTIAGLSTVQNKYNIQDGILRLFSNITKTEKWQIKGLIGVIHHIVIFCKLLEWKA